MRMKIKVKTIENQRVFNLSKKRHKSETFRMRWKLKLKTREILLSLILLSFRILIVILFTFSLMKCYFFHQQLLLFSDIPSTVISPSTIKLFASLELELYSISLSSKTTNTKYSILRIQILNC